MGAKQSKYGNDCIIVSPSAGLGNQLFQIANGYALAKRNNKKLLIHSVWNGMSKSRPSYWRTFLKNLKPYLIHPKDSKKIKKYKEPTFSYTSICILYKSIILEGYYQSEKYFEEYKEEIKSLFQIPEELKPTGSEDFKNGICVAIHVRRGDYLKHQDFHIPMVKEHYTKSKQNIEEKLGIIPNYYYFSDDIEYTKSMFKDETKESDKFISGYKDYEELYLMSLCDHFIIANSTFSWWAAYLSSTQSEESKIVIAPNPWFGPKGPQDFHDIYCKKWISLDLNNEHSLNLTDWKENYKAYYINLETRKDRKDHIENQLSKVLPHFERFNAISHSKGIIGCVKSHIEVLKKGLEQEKEYVFVFEDDFVWELQPEDVLLHLNKVFRTEFNILLLSYHIPVIEPIKISNKGLGFYKNCQTTSGYIIHKRFIHQLLENFENTNMVFEKNPKSLDISLDQNWKCLQTFQNKFFVSIPRLGKQLPSYSDIEKKFVSYGGGCFMGILSCEKYKERRNKQDLKMCPFEYRYFIGNPELSEAIENKEEKIVYLPCNDRYQYLPQKVHEMLKWIISKYPHIDYIFKTDDDVNFNFLNLIQNFQTISFKNFDYTGAFVKCNLHYSNYLKKKDPSSSLIKIPQTNYCPGGGYFISKKCIDILILDLLKENTIFEDQSVGYCLNKNNIFPVKIKLHNYSCYW